MIRGAIWLITADLYKDAIGKTLFDEFGVKWYKEKAAKPVYPAFYINNASISVERDNADRWYLFFLTHITYRHAAEPATVKNINSVLDQMAIDLPSALDLVPIDGGLMRLEKDSYAEKNEGNLEFIGKYYIRVKKEVAEALQLQLDLKIT